MDARGNSAARPLWCRLRLVRSDAITARDGRGVFPPGHPDSSDRRTDVAFWHLADIGDVRLESALGGKADMPQVGPRCLLLTYVRLHRLRSAELQSLAR
jgi:hypothetical protein